MDLYLRTRVLSDIQEYGHSVIGVGAEHHPNSDLPVRPTFSYSIGLTARYNYELLIIGMRPDYATMIINNIAQDVHDGEYLQMGQPYYDWSNLPLMFKIADNRVRDWTIQADRFYGRPVQVVQIVMCDREGRFPHQPGYDHDYMDVRQPLLYKAKT